MERIKDYSKEFILKGKTLTAPMDVAWDYETESVEGSFDFGSEEENEAYLNRFKTGELLTVCIRVRAGFKQLHGSSYLGGCHVPASNLETAIFEMVEEYGLEAEALDELTQNLHELLGLVQE